MSAYSITTRGLPQGVLATMGDLLFAASEPGAWYDPSDMSTLFQDSAGTVPVTAVEQPVGLILDKSKGLVQDNGTSVMNMLATSESLQSGWAYNGLAPVTATPAAITGTTATGYKGIGRVVSLVSGTAYQLAVDFKANGYTKVYLTDLASARIPHTSFDLVALTASRAEATITDIGDGWRRCVLPFTALSTVSSLISFAGYPDAGATLSDWGVQYTGDGVSGVLMRRPDLRLASNAAVEPLYQRTDAFMGLSVLYAGNHATQATTTKRPILSRRVNLLTKTEQFDGAWQVQGNGQETTDGFPGPSGKNNACRVVDTTGNVPYVAQSTGITYSVGVKYRATTYVAPYNGAVSATIYSDFTNSGGAFRTITVNLSTGTFSVSNSAELLDVSVTLVDGFWRISYEGIAQRTTGHAVYTSATASVVGTGLFVAEPSLTLATDAHLPYQRINTDTDYDADPAKFPAYLRWDGVDDALQTGNIDFTGTDKMTVWAGAVFSQSADQMLVNHNATGPMSFRTLTISETSIASAAAGLSNTCQVLSPYPDHTITAQYDLSSGTASARVDGTDAGSSVTPVGGGWFASAPLCVGAQENVTRFFNGRIYGLIVRGAQSNLSQIEATELYIKQKMRLP